MVKFLAVGHSIMDTRCYLKEFPKIDSMAILLKPITNSCGGSAANFSYNLSRMGIKSRIGSSIGNDNVGKFIKHSLKENGIDVSRIRIFKKDSGRAIVIIDKNGNVKVLESLGVSDNYFKPDEKDFKGITNLHITGINKKIIQSFTKYAKKRGIFISADLGRGKVKEGKEKLRSILKRVDMLFLNRIELSLLYGKKLNEKNIRKVAKELGEEFNMGIVVKGGAKKVIAYDKNEDKLYEKEPIKVKVVDTIGAGDAFDAGFMAVYSKTKNFKKSLEFALKIASIKVQRLGAQNLPKTKVAKLYKKYIMA